jgi:hypothetical protein
VAEGEGREVTGFLRAVRERFRDHINDESTDKRPSAAEFSTFEIRF